MKIYLVAIVLALSACTSTPKNNDDDYKNAKGTTAPPDFERGLKALERQDYQTAADMFDRLLVAKPASDLDLVTLFNSGAAHEGLGDCQKAGDRYRQVVRSSVGKFKRLEAQAYYRLSLMYECLGQDTKTITSLLDTRKRASNLPPEVIDAEIPARLAAAYARIGNRNKALEFFNQASQGLKGVVARANGRNQTEVLGQTLFLMGQLNPSQRKGDVSPSQFLQSLSMQQPYLLQAAEMDHQLWSKKAAEDLKLAYENIWQFDIASPEEKREFYTRGLQVAAELKKIRLPDGNAYVRSIFAEVEATETRLQRELTKVAEINRLTPDAEKREGLRREGRAVDPTPPVKKTKKR